MFTNVGWSELLVLGVVALVVLGPERLPDAARWLASAIRKVREFASSAQQQLRDDYGTEFEDFREPLKQLNELRGLSPRAMVTKHLLDGDDSLFTGNFGAAAPAGGTAAAAAATGGASAAAATGGASADTVADGPARAAAATPRLHRPDAPRTVGTPPGPDTSSGAPAVGVIWDSDAT